MDIEEGIQQYFEGREDERRDYVEIRDQKLKSEGNRVVNYLIEKARTVYIYPFFTSWLQTVSEREGAENFSLERIRTTLKNKNMTGRIEKNILELLHEGGFVIN